MMKEVRKIARILGLPIVVLLISLEFAFFTLELHLYYLSNDERTLGLLFESILMLIATFIGIFVPLLIDRNLKKEDDRRMLKFVLSSLHAELRDNLHTLHQIEINFRFKILEKAIPDTLHFIDTITPKIASLKDQANMLQNSGYTAMQQSGNVSTIDEDGYFNDINQTYENQFLFRSTIHMIAQNMKMKHYLLTQTFDPVKTSDKLVIREEVLSQLKRGYAELAYSIKLHEKAIQSLEVKMGKLGIKAELVQREVIEIADLP